ncbi:MSCRAMM family protein [Crossiella sp. CA198]|uniref:MSCRAMM family protein n=1 Tax=Crossiella sp. CA198 TaxID=3455607 RepID=UPI003F8D675B
MPGLRNLLVGAMSVTLAAGGLALAIPGSALAAGERSGEHTKPQEYQGRPKGDDWIGSYTWRGRQVWCVRYALDEPGDALEYTPSKDGLTTKWNTPLPAETKAKISYLLLRYQDTASKPEAAALAHLLHSWTSGTKDPKLLAKTNNFTRIGYDVDFHLNGLSAEARQAVGRLQADAEAHYGPWKLTVAAPKDGQLIGKPGNWTITVTSAKGQPVSGVPVKLKAIDAELAGEASDGAVKTPAGGTPLVVAVTPRGPSPRLVATVESPNADPVLLLPNKPTAQRALTTGGQTPVSAEATVPAVTQPGIVKIGKVDAASGAAIPGVTLRITGPDKEAPALKQDGSPLTGVDGKPLVVKTGDDGQVSVADLRTPQEICLIELIPAKGYEEGFDPKKPPTVCGTVAPGNTLALSLTNKANVPKKPVVPRVIPAGDQPDLPVAQAATVTQVEPAGLVGFAIFTLVMATLGVMALRRRLHQR